MGSLVDFFEILYEVVIIIGLAALMAVILYIMRHGI